MITTHTSLEGDAIGSALSLYTLIRYLGKRARVVTEDPVPDCYRFLPGADIIEPYSKRTSGIRYDCFALVDCSDLGRCGKVAQLKVPQACILNIDHHVSNRSFGQANWIDPGASSCAEQIYVLYKMMRVPLNKTSATLLYVGMLTDTGSFRYSNTTSVTHRACADLLTYGVEPRKVFHEIYENVPYADLQLLGKVLPAMQRAHEGKTIYFEISRTMLPQQKLSFDLSEHVLSFGRQVQGAQVVVFFKENSDPARDVRVNLRSQGVVDVNKIAAAFGGGGHKTASGCTVAGSLTSVRRRVLAKIRESL